MKLTKDIFHTINLFYKLSGIPNSSPNVYANGLLYEEQADYLIVTIPNGPVLVHLLQTDLTLPITVQVHYEVSVSV